MPHGSALMSSYYSSSAAPLWKALPVIPEAATSSTVRLLAPFVIEDTVSQYLVSRRVMHSNGLWSSWTDLDDDTLKPSDTAFTVDDLPPDSAVQIRVQAMYVDGRLSAISSPANAKTLPEG